MAIDGVKIIDSDDGHDTVSYTHLDVYKRQVFYLPQTSIEQDFYMLIWNLLI